jgi:hypothetical protein
VIRRAGPLGRASANGQPVPHWNGGPWWTRTTDLALIRGALSPPELRAHGASRVYSVAGRPGNRAAPAYRPSMYESKHELQPLAERHRVHGEGGVDVVLLGPERLGLPEADAPQLGLDRVDPAPNLRGIRAFGRHDGLRLRHAGRLPVELAPDGGQ